MILLISYLIYIICDAKSQADYIEEEGKYPNHFNGAVEVIICSAIVACAFTEISLLDRVSVFLYLLAVRWILFDILLNLFRDKTPYYIGKPDKQDATLDNLLLCLPYPEVTQYIIKAMFLYFAIYFKLIYKFIQLCL